MKTGRSDDIALDDATITSLVNRFYERVRADPRLGPVFDGAIADWDDHLRKLADFWSSVMLRSGRYKGNPVAAHLRQASVITPAMFERWLELWSEVTLELLPYDAARAMQARAATIAESLKLALFFRLPSSSSERASPAAAS